MVLDEKSDIKKPEHYCFRCEYRGNRDVQATKQISVDLDIANLYVCDNCSYIVAGILGLMFRLEDMDKKDKKYWKDKL